MFPSSQFLDCCCRQWSWWVLGVIFSGDIIGGACVMGVRGKVWSNEKMWKSITCLITQVKDTGDCIYSVWVRTTLSNIKKEIGPHCYFYSSLTCTIGLVMNFDKIFVNSIILSMIRFIDINGKYWDPRLDWWYPHLLCNFSIYMIKLYHYYWYNKVNMVTSLLFYLVKYEFI